MLELVDEFVRMVSVISSISIRHFVILFPRFEIVLQMGIFNCNKNSSCTYKFYQKVEFYREVDFIIYTVKWLNRL
jgi:hypothetical protein